ncbi:hypothetical protein HanIR_Chr03g0132461 [Helianthus annuus]|nr:hypothetical protein HanIR_Chr03g0132461 [Helianthus annuus]
MVLYGDLQRSPLPKLIPMVFIWYSQRSNRSRLPPRWELREENRLNFFGILSSQPPNPTMKSFLYPFCQLLRRLEDWMSLQQKNLNNGHIKI